MIGAIGCLPESPDASQWIVFKVWAASFAIVDPLHHPKTTVGAGLDSDAGAVVGLALVVDCPNVAHRIISPA